MSYLDYIKESIQEAYSLKLAKKYTRGDKGKYKNLYPEIFGKENRVYVDMSVPEGEYENMESTTKQKITELLKKEGAETVDYIKGYYTKNKQTMKIGKFLSQSKEDKLLKEFSDDPIRQVNLKIVISKHPYDIAGMSTGRKWESCMNIISGSNCNYVKEEIKEGTIVAYLIRPKDTNVQNPLARLLLKPYVKGKNVVLQVSSKIYGLNVPAFKETLKEFVYNNFNKKNISASEFQDQLSQSSFPRAKGTYDDGEASEYTGTSAIKDAVENNDLETFETLLKKFYK